MAKVDWSQFTPVAEPEATGVDWSQFALAPDAIDTSVQKFKAAADAEAKADATERTWTEFATDTGKSLTQGAIDATAGLGGFLYGAATGDHNNASSNFARGMNEIIGKGKSDKSKADTAAIQAAVDAAEGGFEKAAVGGWETLSNPTAMLDQVARSAPGMLAGGVVGRVASKAMPLIGNTILRAAPDVASKMATVGLKVGQTGNLVGGAAATGTAALTQGSSVANDTYEAAIKVPIEVYASVEGFKELAAEHGAEQAKEIMASDATTRAGVMGTLASVLSMKVIPGGGTMEKMFLPAAMRGEVGKVGTNILTKPLTQGFSGGIGSKAGELLVGGTAKGIGEGFSEGLEEGSGAIAKALSVSPITGETPDLETVAMEAAGQAAPLGFLMGKAGGLRDGSPAPATPIAPTVESQPTTPVAPVVTPRADQRTTAQQILDAEGDAGVTTTPGAPTVTAEAPLVEPTALPTPVPNYTATPDAAGTTLPQAVDQRTRIAAELEALKARQTPPVEPTPPPVESGLTAEMAKIKGYADLGYNSTLPKAVTDIVQRTNAAVETHSDLQDTKTYPDAVLTRIAANPQADAGLRTAVAVEQTRRVEQQARTVAAADANRAQALSGDSVEFNSLPTTPRPLSVERGLEIAKVSRTRALIPQESGYMDALKAEIGPEQFEIVKRAGAAPYMLTVQNKFDLPKAIAANQQAIAKWDEQSQKAAPARIEPAQPAIETVAPATFAPKVRNSIPTPVAPVVTQPVTQNTQPRYTKPVEGVKSEGVDGFTSPDTVAVDGKDTTSLAPTKGFEPNSEVALGMPTFKGNKRTMLGMAVSAIRQHMDGGSKVTQIDDWFGGGGMWSTSLANATLPNVKKIRISELNPLRIKRIQWMHERGDKMFEDMQRTGALDVYRKLLSEFKSNVDPKTGAASPIVSPSPFEQIGLSLAGFAEKGTTGWNRAQGSGALGLSEEGKVTLSLLGDLAFNNRGSKIHEASKLQLPDGTTADKFLAKAMYEMAAAHKQAQAFKARGGVYEYFPAGSSFDIVGTNAAQGDHVLSLADPPYYNTSGYKGAGDLSTGDKWNANGYAASRDLLKTLVDKGNHILYTDEAWWKKEDQLPDAAQAGPILGQINQHLSGLHVAPEKVGGRYEQLGIHNPNARRGGNIGSAGSKVQGETAVGPRVGDSVRGPNRPVAQGTGGQGRGTTGTSDLKFSRTPSKLQSALGYFDNYPVGYPIGYAKAEPTERTLTISDLLPTQDSVHQDGIDKYKADTEGALPEVVLDKKSGKHILLDGHHRVAAAIQRGESSVRVNVVGETEKAQAFSGYESDMQVDWRASHPEQAGRTVRDVVNDKDVGQGGEVKASRADRNLDQDITLDIPIEGGGIAKMTVNAQTYLKQLDARQSALQMVKECMA